LGPTKGWSCASTTKSASAAAIAKSPVARAWLRQSRTETTAIPSSVIAPSDTTPNHFIGLMRNRATCRRRARASAT